MVLAACLYILSLFDYVYFQQKKRYLYDPSSGRSSRTFEGSTIIETTNMKKLMGKTKESR
jgi:hypothetical protein